MGRNKDFDDEDFSFDDDNDELRGGMGDEEGEFGFDDDLGDLGDEGFGEFDMGEPGEDFALEEEPTAAEGGRSSRTFVTLAVAMIALFLIGLAVVLFLATRAKPPSPVELTASAVVAFNSTQSVFATQTAQANAILFVTQTAEALATDTPTPTPTFTPTLTPTPPPVLPTLDLTQQAGTQIALQQTLIAGAPTLTFTPPVPSGGISPEDVQATATALAQLLLASPTPEQLTTTPGIGGVLLIDDIQFIAGKESTQEEFFHTFNTLHGQDKQLVMTSDRPPKAMVTLEERLRSRFEWGLTVDIQPPDFETRQAILRSKAERAQRAVDPAVVELIARRVQSNIRELEGALTRVIAYADLIGQPLSLELATSALADLLPRHRSLTSPQIIEAVASFYNTSLEALTGRDRSKDVALPRQVAMYLMREETNASLPAIGDALGGRDHTTIMYGCDKISDLVERDDSVRRDIIRIRERLYSQVELSV